MKKELNTRLWSWLLLLGLLLTGTTTFVSCAVEDNPVKPDESQKEITEVFNDEVNKLIDANYPEVVANGYAKLVIPKSLYPKGLFTFSANAAGDMQYMVDAGY